MMVKFLFLRTTLWISVICFFTMTSLLYSQEANFPGNPFHTSLILAWSPDGTRIAYGGAGHSCEENSTLTNDIDILDITSGSIIQTLTGPQCPITSLDWKPDGNAILASSFEPFGVKIWDTNKGELLTTSDLAMQGVNAAKWHSDGQYIAVAQNAGITVLMNASDGHISNDPLFAGGQAVDWSPDGKQLVLIGVSDSNPSVVYLVDVATETTTELFRSEKFLYSMDWSNDGTKIAVGDQDGSVQIWEIEAEEIVSSFFDHEDPVRKVEWNIDGRRLATVSYDDTIRVYDVETGKTIKIIRGKGHMHDVAWSPDGTQLAYSDGGELLIVSAPEVKPTLIATEEVSSEESVFGESMALAWSPDGTRIAYARTGGVCAPEGSTLTNNINVLDVASQTVTQTIEGYPCPLSSLDWRPDGDAILALTSDAFGVRVWDINTGALISTLNPGGQGINGAKWSPDGQVIAFADSANFTAYMDPLTGTMSIDTLFPGGHAVDWSPDGHQLVTASYNDRGPDSVYIHDINSGTMTEIVESESFFEVVDWSEEKNKIAIGNSEGKVLVWNETTQQIEITLHGHQDSVADVAWHPDGRRLATASYDGTIRVYDVETGNTLKIIRGKGYMHDIAWSPDGTKVAYGDGGELIVRPAPEIEPTED
jgi:WD40 repeat protein